MQNKPENMKLRRAYLMDQVLDVLRKHIEVGDWGDYLPPERALSERMQIGRNTPRQAIAVLEKEGVIEKGHAGRRRKILSQKSKAKSGATNRVVMLTPQDPHRLSSYFLREMDILRRLFNDSGIRLEPLSSKAFNVENCDRILDRLTHVELADLWILQLAPHPVQEWFARNNVPAMVIGYTYPELVLPFVTENNLAAARHASGLLSAKGHKSVALLQQYSVLAGHELVSQAFHEMCRSRDMSLTIASYRGGTDELCRRLDSILQSEKRPTAILTTKTPDTLTCVTHLARNGMTVPEDMSVISLFDDTALDGVVPAITRYGVNEEHFMHQVFTMGMKIVSGRKLQYEPVQLIPELIKGKSVARPPE